MSVQPGVGWTLRGRPLTSRGELIRVNVHPLGKVSYSEAANPARFPLDALETRWPSYRRGFDGAHPPAVQEEMLRVVFQAGRIPGLAPDQYALYTGNPTAEEIIDLYALERNHPDKTAIMRAWEEASRPPVDPKPGPIPVVPPVVQPPVAAGLRPLSPAATRTAELLSAAQPFVLETLRLWRLIRAKLGDTRPIPQEDR